jgi:hypothetical protein
MRVRCGARLLLEDIMNKHSPIKLTLISLVFAVSALLVACSSGGKTIDASEVFTLGNYHYKLDTVEQYYNELTVYLLQREGKAPVSAVYDTSSLSFEQKSHIEVSVEVGGTTYKQSEFSAKGVDEAEYKGRFKFIISLTNSDILPSEITVTDLNKDGKSVTIKIAADGKEIQKIEVAPAS